MSLPRWYFLPNEPKTYEIYISSSAVHDCSLPPPTDFTSIFSPFPPQNPLSSPPPLVSSPSLARCSPTQSVKQYQVTIGSVIPLLTPSSLTGQSHRHHHTLFNKVTRTSWDFYTYDNCCVGKGKPSGWNSHKYMETGQVPPPHPYNEEKTPPKAMD